VLSVEDITHKSNVSRDLVLIKVKAGPDKRPEVLQLCEVFRARFIDVHPESLIVEVTGTQDKIEGLVAMLAPFGILEMVQTGTVAMTRGGKGDAAEAVYPAPALKGVTPNGTASPRIFSQEDQKIRRTSKAENFWFRDLRCCKRLRRCRQATRGSQPQNLLTF